VPLKGLPLLNPSWTVVLIVSRLLTSWQKNMVFACGLFLRSVRIWELQGLKPRCSRRFYVARERATHKAFLSG
jgi:hypothetical protein